jgi:hypothetical protein
MRRVEFTSVKDWSATVPVALFSHSTASETLALQSVAPRGHAVETLAA